MPGAFASLDTGFPNLSGNGSAEDKLRAVQDYLYQLLEQLRYSMNNLGAENFNENSLNDMANTITKPIKAEIQDVAAGLTTLIEVTAGQVLVQVTSDLAPEWAKNVQYKKDDVVKVTPAAGSNDAVAYYRAKSNHTSSDATKPGSGTSWGTYWAEDTLTGISQSIIKQTADSITSTVASAQSKYDLSKLPAGISISAYGYGAPTVQAASGTVYLDQATGYWYTSDGSTWTQSEEHLPMITTEMQSQITQLPGEIMLDVRGDYAPEWRQHSAGNPSRYYVSDVVKISSSSAIAFYKCKAEHNAVVSTKPGSGSAWTDYWDAVASPSVHSMIDAGLGGITLSYDAGQSSANTPYITLNKDGTTIGGGPVYIGELNADTIKSGTIDAQYVSFLDEFLVYARTQVIDGVQYKAYCGGIGGSYTDQNNVRIKIASNNSHNFIALEHEKVLLWCGDDQGQDESIITMSPTEVVSTRAIVMPSDVRIKKDIDHDLSRYENFFLSLRPCRYRMIDETSGVYHTGYIAQEVEQALLDNGLSADDLAALAKRPDVDGYSEEDPQYGLRYSEMIALQTYMIQQLEKRIADLEERVTILEGN